MVFSDLIKWKAGCRAERLCFYGGGLTIAQIFLLNYDPHKAPLQLNCVFALVRAEPDRLCLQIVSRADEAHGFAFRAH